MAEFSKDYKSNLQFQSIPQDLEKDTTGVKKLVSLMDYTSRFAMNSAALRFGTYNYGTPEWDKRNAHQHLIWSALNPTLTGIYEVSNEMTRGEIDNQDIHNNKLRKEVINRANELDARKNKKGNTTTEDSIEQASFNMIKEQEKRLEQGLMQSPTLPWIDTSKDMPGYTEAKISIKDAALNISKQFFK